MTPQERKNPTTIYQPIVEQIVERWAAGKPPLPATGKPSGYYRLTNYLLEYLVAHGAFPAGVHAMPEGRDCHQNIEPSFPVDFDAVIGDVVLPDSVLYEKEKLMSATVLVIEDEKARALYDVEADEVFLPVSGGHLESAKTLCLPLRCVDDEPGVFIAPSDWKQILPDSAGTIDSIEQGLLKMGREAAKEL